MEKIIEFKGLKTNTSFKFKNRKQQDEYWDNLLIKDVIKYKNEFIQYLKELTHVYFSFSKIFQFFGIFMAILILVTYNNMFLALINMGLLLLFSILFIVFHYRFAKFAFLTVITEELYTNEFLELLRDSIIKKDNK